MNSDPDELPQPPPPRAWWRCPGAVVAFHAQRAFFGLAMAWPLARWVAGRTSGRVGGDATLFDDGGVLLAEALRQIAPLSRPLLGSSVVVAAVAFVGGHVALAALIDAIGRPEPVGLRARLKTAFGPLPLLVLVSLASLVLEAALFGLVWWSGRSLARSAFDAPQAADLAAAAVILAGMAAASWLGVARDLVAVGIVGRRLGFTAALDLAWKTLRGRASGLWLQHAIRSLAAGVVLVTAALAAIRIGLRGQRDATLAQLLLEASLVAATCLRASWLGLAALAIHDRAAEPPAFASALPDEEDSSKNPPAAAPR